MRVAVERDCHADVKPGGMVFEVDVCIVGVVGVTDVRGDEEGVGVCLV